mgnify:CR=1 FL=1|jgi:hypothetical protein
MTKSKMIQIRMTEPQKRQLSDIAWKNRISISKMIADYIEAENNFISLKRHVKDKQYQTLDGVV